MSGSNSGSGSGDTGNAACQCNHPYTGNGTHCDPPDPCDAGVCSENADCMSVLQNGTFEVECTCHPMFIGNGRTCMRECRG